MSDTNMNSMRLLSKRIEYLNTRQSIIAQNIANADTPGYKSVDTVPFEKHLQSPGPRLRPVATNSRHMPGTLASPSVETYRDPSMGNEALNGNNVILEMEMLKQAEIQDDHAVAASLYKRASTILRSAITRN